MTPDVTIKSKADNVTTSMTRILMGIGFLVSTIAATPTLYGFSFIYTILAYLAAVVFLLDGLKTTQGHKE